MLKKVCCLPPYQTQAMNALQGIDIDQKEVLQEIHYVQNHSVPNLLFISNVSCQSNLPTKNLALKFYSSILMFLTRGQS